MRLLSRLPGLVSALAIVTLLAAPSRAHAQETPLTDVEHWEIVTYGEAISFNLRASAPVPLVRGALVVRGEHLADPYRVEVPFAPGQRVELSHSVPVADLRLPAFARLQVQWVFQDEAGSPYATAPVALSYADNTVPWAWAVQTQGGVTVYTDGASPDVANAALSTAVTAAAQTRRVLGVASVAEIHVFVYPELSQLVQALRLHGENVQDWVAAYAIPAYRVALVAASPGPEGIASLRRDIPHEVTHLVLAEAAGPEAARIPGWFAEGLALLGAPEADPTLSRVLHEAADRGTLLPLEALCAPRFTGLAADDTALAYAQSESVMRYIDHRFGAAYTQRLLAAYADGMDCQAGVQRALGISLAQLESQWHNDLLSQAARTPQNNLSAVPWLIVWFVSLGLALLFVAPQPSRRQS